MKNLTTVEDLVINSDFREWVLKPNASANIFWEKWLKNNPDKEDSLKEAVRFVQLLGRISYEHDTQFAESTWSKIEAQIAHVKTMDREIVPLNVQSVVKQTKKSSGSKKFNYWLLGLAATVLLLFATIAMLVTEDNRFYSQKQRNNVSIVKSNPKGQKSTIMLPDGTMVILNSASSLSYTNHYNTNERRVKLQGEAFFDVSENPNKPFIVETARLKTTALGTSFNVNAYINGVEEVTLITGRVKIENFKKQAQPTELLPGEMIQLDEVGLLRKFKVDSFEHIGWKDGLIVFKDAPLKEAMLELEKWYGVEINLINYPGNSNMSFTGAFSNDNLSNVLQSLSYTIPFDFEIEDKKVVVKFK